MKIWGVRPTLRAADTATPRANVGGFRPKVVRQRRWLDGDAAPLTLVVSKKKKMNAEMQKRIAEFVKLHGLDTAVVYRVLDLVSEIGELSKEILKATDYGNSGFKHGENWEEELGDVLFSLICVANSTGVDLEQALSKVLEKYRKRIESKQDAGSGR